MRRWLPRVVALATVAALLVVVDGAPASAAPVYQLLAVTTQNTPLDGNSAHPTISSDGRLVAFAQQTGAECATSGVFLRDRQQRTTTAVGTGILPAITPNGSQVAFVSCPSGQAPALVLWSASASATVATRDQWTNGSADTVKSVAVSPSGTAIAFTVGPASDPATKLWLAHSDRRPPVPVALPGGALGAVDVTDGFVYFVVEGKAYRTPTSDPSQRTQLTALGQSVQRLSVSGDGHVIAFYEGSGVFVSIDGNAPAAQPVAAGAFDPDVSPDGSAVAVKTNGSTVQVFTTGNPATLLSSAPRSADGVFDAPVVADGGREVVFVAQRGAAAGGSSTNDQVYALGPGLNAGAANFGDVGVGTTTTKAVSFTNDGTTTVTPSSVTSSNSEFAILPAGTTCVATRPVAVGQSCAVQVALTPVAAGARTATLTVAQQDGSWDAPSATVTLTAAALNGQLSAEPITLDFGAVTVGSSSSPRTFTVTNAGALPTTIGTLLVSGGQAPEFPLAGGTCAGATLTPAATCTVSVGFKPGGTGLRSASLDVGGSGGAAVSVAVSGTGTDPPRPALGATPPSLDFGEQVIGSAGAAQAVTVRNSGNVANTPSVQVGGPAAADFTIASNGCTRSLSAGSSCTVNVSFGATGAGARAATLTISGTGGSSATVRLSGTGRLNPVLAAGPTVIVPGQVVTVTGSNFPPGAPVALTWDVGGTAATAVADATGSFSAVAVMPAGVGGGTRHLLVASPPEAAAATAAVLVQPPLSGGGPSSPVFVNSPAWR